MAFNKETCIADMRAVLDTWEVRGYADLGLNATFDNWLEKKSWLRDKLSTHPDWDEQNQAIVQEVELNRTFNVHAVYRLYEEFIQRWRSTSAPDDVTNILTDHILKYVYTEESVISRRKREQMMDNARNVVEHFRHCSIGTRFINGLREWSDFIQDGQKYPKVINKMCEALGLIDILGTTTNSHGDTVRWYDQWFAKYSDAVNPKKKKYVIALSIHPCDYLNMSHGTGWRSCHNMRDGGCRAGCLSYLTDTVTMVLSVYEKTENNDKLFLREKVKREMIMWHEGTMLQSRLYPDNNDKNFKEIALKFVKDIINTCMNKTDANWLTVLKCGTNEYDRYWHTTPGSVHYPDYRYADYGTTIHRLDIAEIPRLEIGSETISLSVGQTFKGGSGDLFGNFMVCPHCGKVFSKNDPHETIDGQHYCSDCAFRCAICGQVHLIDDAVAGAEFAGGRVCHTCYEDNQRKCLFCGEFGFAPEMRQGINPDGRLNGKYAHKNCLSDKYGSCSCNKFQRIEYMHTLHSPGNVTRTMCSVCAGIVVGWLETE